MANQFYDEIFDYYSRPFWQTSWFIASTIILVLCLIATAIIMYMYFRKKPLTPWDYALGQLQKLSPSRCVTQHDYKLFYFELTALTKQYLAQRYAWDTAYKTDTELIIFLEEQSFNKDIIGILKKIAEGATWIKFANMDALKTQAESDWLNVKTMIEQTKPHKNS